MSKDNLAITISVIALITAGASLLVDVFGTVKVEIVGSAQPDNVVAGEQVGATFAVTNDPDFLDEAFPVTCSGHYQGPEGLELHDMLELSFGQTGILDIIADVPGTWAFDLACTSPLGETLLANSGSLQVGQG